jgi:hypothetical protein
MSIAPPMPFTISLGIIQLARLPDSSTSIAQFTRDALHDAFAFIGIFTGSVIA